MSAGGCRTCGGFDPLDGREPVCQCGRLWAVDDIDWDVVMHFLVVRSGQRCEARTPACLGRFPGGMLTDLTRSRVSIHHRLPRQMGGDRDVDVHSMARLMLLCGSGTAGCHGFIESERTVAEARGYLVRRGQHPAEVPVTMPSGRRVLLDPASPVYVWQDWGLGVPDWPAAA